MIVARKGRNSAEPATLDNHASRPASAAGNPSNLLFAFNRTYDPLAFFTGAARKSGDLISPKAAAIPERFAYFPFGGGPRICIGETFAWTEAVLILATIAQRWRIRLAPAHRPTPHAMVTLPPRNGVKVIVERL